MDMPKIGLVLMSFLYAAGFLSGVFLAQGKKDHKAWIVVVPFSAIVLFLLINGVKAGLLFLTIFFISGYMATMVLQRAGILTNPGKLIAKGFFVATILIGSIPLSHFSREVIIGKNPILNSGSISYLGSFIAFTNWYLSDQSPELSGFRYTFSGIHNLIYKNRQVGLYGSESVTIGEFSNTPVKTNVYTMARGLIEDLSFGGALIAVFFSGILTSALYLQTKRKQRVCFIFLAVFYSVLLNAFTVSILNYNTIILAWFVAGVTWLFLANERFSGPR